MKGISLSSRTLATTCSSVSTWLAAQIAPKLSGILVGFVCVLLDAEPAWGAYLDNLHVQPGLTGQGLRGQLLVRALQWVAQVEPGWATHLLVLEGNAEARRFYERHGGELVETLTKPMPDGSNLPVCRYHWQEPGGLFTTLPSQG
jgi:GNAT superfamily N-acetyltransferase